MGGKLSHIELGKLGETLALVYLTKKGFSILHQNWRYSRFEIDIIAAKDNILHIVEVKTLYDTASLLPEDSVTKKKFRFIAHAADEFLSQHPEYRHIQFNILSITLDSKNQPEFFWIEDVFL